MVSSTDQIRKQVVLKAPLARVWRAISDAEQFGAWFGVAFDGPFAAGSTMQGTIAGTKADPDVAAEMQAYNGQRFTFEIVAIEPMTRFAYRWHPFAIERGVDYSHEPTTLVTFELAEVAGGTQLTITESGFDALPEARRGDAFEANDGGWTTQSELVAKYLALYP
jgi:uncharacterized protein YndB with AHSA1/START domain